ncbi:MAG: ABC transporter ATP-binding protein [Francisellaceae bacterium]|nr:ABC transporter ATP-binding protein [Francisellaceae bacterium]
MAAPYKIWFYCMVGIGIYASIHSVLHPYFIKSLLDSATSSNANNFLQNSIVPGSVLIGISFVINFMWRFYNYVVLKSIPKMKADIIRVSTKHLRGQSFQFFQNELSGSLGTKVNDLTSSIQDLFNSFFNVSRQTLTILLSTLVAWSVSPYFAMIFIIMTILFILMSYYCGNSISPYSSDFARSRAKNIGNIVDCFANIRNMLLFARENYEEQYLERTTSESLNKDSKMQIKNMKNASVLCFLAWLLEVFSIVTLIYLGSKGLMTIGDFALILILSMTVIEQVWHVAETLLSLGGKIGICQQALDTIFTPHIQETTSNKAKIQVTEGKVEFRNISFRYTRDTTIINDLNLTIPGGKKYGLVGYSGAGKSTIVQLLTRLFDPTKGETFIDEQSISQVNIQSLREKIAFIPQSPTLFHRSIYENIIYGNENSNMDQVILAAETANAHEFISCLPEGYETIVGESGIKLSGGQRQRVAIARAILKDAPILVLDEATSSLDSITEMQIQEAMNKAMANRTVIVIAHRLSTILSMDNILVFDNGKIIEQGTHQQLIKLDDFYKSLWDSQSGHSRI